MSRQAFAACGVWAAAAASLASCSPQSPTVESRVDAVFAQIRPDGPGCAVGVFRNGDTVLTRSYGLASLAERRAISPQTNFNLGSLSKPFTTLAVLLLEQRGTLSDDDDVRKWVPELPDYGTPIRVRDLLHQTSGLRDFQSLQLLSGKDISSSAEFLGLIKAQQALNFVPGTQHEYSHSDYELLGLVVERAAGVPFGEHLARDVLQPMGMKNTAVRDVATRVITDRADGHNRAGQGATVRASDYFVFGGDNLHASISDLARFDRNFDDPVVGGPAAIARMVGRPKLPNGDTVDYAYGLRLGTYRGLRTVYRGGHAEGFQAEVVRFPEERFTVATLCNADDLYAANLARSVADIYLGDKMRPARPRPQSPAAVTMTPQELAPYAGIYRPSDKPWNLQPIEVRNGVLGEVLFDDATDEAFYPMAPAGAGRFFEIGSTGNVGIFTFTQPASGAPMRLEISWNEASADVLERVPETEVWRPSAAALADYAGTWFSQDVDAVWQLEVRGTTLVMRRQNRPDLTLRPVARDQFQRAFGPDGDLNARIEFHRTRAGALSDFTVSTGPGDDSVRGLRFIRRR